MIFDETKEEKLNKSSSPKNIE